jgi:hypothetical protein
VRSCLIALLTGLVPTAVVTTFIQIFSRVLLAVGIVYQIPEAQRHWLITTMIRACQFITAEQESVCVSESKCVV